MLGGFFGGGKKDAATKRDANDATTSTATANAANHSASTPKQNDAPSDPSEGKPSVTTSDDEMAFGDEPLPKP